MGIDRPDLSQEELEVQNRELRQAQMELDAARRHYFNLYDLAPIGYCTLSATGLILQANIAAATLLGCPREELLGEPIHGFILEEQYEAFNRYFQQLFDNPAAQGCDLRMQKKDGTVFWAQLSLTVKPGVDGEPICLATFSDITTGKLAEQVLQEQKEFFHLIAENLSDFIAVLDLNGRRLYNSPSYRQLFGEPEDLRNSDSFAEIHPDDRERVRQVFLETVQTGLGRQIEYRFLLPDGSIRDMESRGSVIKDQCGRVVRVVVVSQDITERKQLLDQVQQMAFHDALTGLPNRRLFTDRFSQAMAASSRNACYGALVFLDLDNFKLLNDHHGHDVGDSLLIEAANRLKHCVREIDTVARFGGDEFVVMLGQLDMDRKDSIAQARVIAEKLRVALAEPYLLNVTRPGRSGTTLEYCCTTSIGVDLFSHLETNQCKILKRADSAMYQAKKAGGNQVRFCHTKA
jgi:diguanylate cyclase (GGDEF)-like protein/PAS domain S-box-containing protein